MSYRLERFGSATLPEYNGESDVGSGPSRESYIELPSGGLWDSFGSDQAPRAATTITFRGVMAYDTPELLDTAFRALKAMRGKQERLYRRYVDGTVEWTLARLVKIDASKMIGAMTHQEVSMSFRMQSPTWYGAGHTTWFLDDGEYFDAGLVLDALDTEHILDVSPKTVTITNNGNAQVRDVAIEIEAGSDDITSLTLAVAGVSSVTFGSTVLAGNTLEMDSGARSVENNGVADYNHLTRDAGHTIAGWLYLEPGENLVVITLTGGNTDSKVRFGFRDGWE